MREVDAFVLPSVEDAYPLVVLEAMASGLPVVVAENIGTASLVTEPGAGIVVPALTIIRERAPGLE